jgi:hypothetical protein
VFTLSNHEAKVLDFAALAPAAPVGGAPAAKGGAPAKGGAQAAKQPKKPKVAAKPAADTDQRGIEYEKE